MARRYGSSLALRRMLLPMLLAAGRTWAEDDPGFREHMGRNVLEQVPHWGVPSDFSFSVPIPLVRAYFMETLLPDSLTESKVPTQVVRSQWAAHVAVSNKVTDVRVEMDTHVLDASPLRPAKVALFPADTIYANLTINGFPVTPIRDKDWFVVYLNSNGKHQIKATLSPPVEQQGAAHQLSLSRRGFAVSNLRFISKEALEVSLSGTSGGLKGDAERGTDGTLAVGGEKEHFTLEWKPVRPAIVRDGIPSVSTSVAWTIEERMLVASAFLEVRITGGSRDELVLQLPDGADRISISGADVRETLQTGSTAKVFLKGRVRGATRLHVAFDIPRRQSDSIALPDIKIAGGRVAEGGWLLVGNDAGGELLEDGVPGYTRTTLLEVPPEVGGLSRTTPLHIYRRQARNASARFDLVKTTPFPLVDTIADKAVVHCVIRPDGEEIVKIAYAMRNNRGQFLRVKLPDGARILSVSVEDLVKRPSQKGDDVLIPLAKSVQTMQGLVAFPVELVYLRKGAPLEGKERRIINLPELVDVPIAQTSATVFMPEELKVRKTGGSLDFVQTFADASAGFKYGYGYSKTPPPKKKPSSSGKRKRRWLFWKSKTPATEPWAEDSAPEAMSVDASGLYRNYYAQGISAYKDNDLETAEKYLNQAVELGGDRDDDAANVLGNIQLLAGGYEVKKGTKQDRAKAAQISRNISGNNLKTEMVQSGVIAEGLRLIEEGQEEKGLERLEQADKLGAELSSRGQTRQQVVVQSRYRETLDAVKTNQRKNEALKEKLSDLQQDAKKIVSDSRNNEQLGRQLILNLGEAAITEDVDAYEAEELVLGTQPSAFASKDKPRSLEEDNRKLEKQVQVLHEALEKTQSQTKDPLPGVQKHTSRSIEINAQRRIATTRTRADALVRKLSEPSAAPVSGSTAWVDDISIGKDLEGLKKERDALHNVYGGGIAQAGDELREIDQLITQGEIKLKEAEKSREEAKQVVVGDFDQLTVDGVQSEHGQQAFANFLSYNNDLALEDGDNINNPVDIVNGNIAVANFGGNAEILNETVQNLAVSGGQVVSVAGTNVDASFLQTDNPVSALFDNNTESGQRYAVLDEAQYRTLLETGQGLVEGKESSQGQRAVVPNTWNRVAGQKFQLQEAGADFNGIVLGNQQVNLTHDQYLAVDNGGFVTVLKASGQHNWQEQVDLLTELQPVESDRHIIFPAVGTPYLFEKTLLAEGESMDMVIEYDLSRKR